MIKKIMTLMLFILSVFSKGQGMMRDSMYTLLASPADSAFIKNSKMLVESAPQMADNFRQEGKIYVVITVIAMIFIAIVCFLVYIERKLNKIENKISEKS